MEPPEAVNRWFSTRAQRDLNTADFAQIDIDELFDEPPKDAVRVGLRCLDLALYQARTGRPDLDGILTVPLAPSLPPSESLDTRAPALSAYVEKPWTYGPGIKVVGLYLTHPRLWRIYEAVEEYRRHLLTDDLLPPGYVAYYRSWQTDTEAASGWEYNRTIYVCTT